jgi:ribokinase
VAVAEGRPAREAAAFACACGAFAVTRAQVLPGLPHREEVAVSADGPY